MTIQEYKNTLQCWLTTFADCGVTTDAIYGAQLMFNYAIEMAQSLQIGWINIILIQLFSESHKK